MLTSFDSWALDNGEHEHETMECNLNYLKVLLWVETTNKSRTILLTILVYAGTQVFTGRFTKHPSDDLVMR